MTIHPEGEQHEAQQVAEQQGTTEPTAVEPPPQELSPIVDAPPIADAPPVVELPPIAPVIAAPPSGPSAFARLRSWFSAIPASMDAGSARLAKGGRGFAWLALYAMSIGGTAFVASHRNLLPLLATNKIPVRDTYLMAGWAGGALLLLGLVHLAALIVVRLRRGAWRQVETGAEVNRRLYPVLALPFLVALTTPNLEKDSPKETFFWIALAAAAVGLGVYSWTRPAPGDPADGPDPRPESRAGKLLAPALAGLAVVAIGVAYSVFFSRMAITNHHALNSRTIDLGYYDNIFWHSIHGKPLGCSFLKGGNHGSAHFDPLLVLLSPLYLLYPRAEFLLVLQAVWLASGVVPVYLLARHHLGARPSALAIAAMYALYPALHGANMYEFHSLTLLSPILLWLLYFLESEATKRYYATLFIALLCREDVSLLLCFVSLYALLSGRPKLTRAGWITACASVVYFIVVKRFFMVSPDLLNSGGGDSYSFAYYYEDLIPNKNGSGGLLVSLVTNPAFALKTMLAEPKIHYLLTLFVPVLFLPFAARPGRVMLGYGLIFCLLATRSAVFSTHFQYSSLLIPVAFALTPMALRRVEQSQNLGARGLDGTRLRRALTGAALAASVLVSWKFGGLVENKTFRGGFIPVVRVLSDRAADTYAWVRAQTAQIPSTASVAVTDRTGPHVSNRRDAYFYPAKLGTDFVFIDEGELNGADLEKHNKRVKEGSLVLVSRREKLALYRKR